jgi:predicted DNA-binding transcriptional regulator AlpA
MEHSHIEQLVDSNLQGLEKLLTVKQVAKIYGECDGSTIWRWVKQGILPKPVKVGGRTLWRKSEIHKNIWDARS